MFLFQTTAKTASAQTAQQAKAFSSQELNKKLDQLYVRTEVAFDQLEGQFRGITKLQMYSNSSTIHKAGALVGMGRGFDEKASALIKSGSAYNADFTDFKGKYNSLKAALRSSDSQKIASALEGISRTYFNLLGSQAKYAQLLNDYDIRGVGYAKSVLDFTLDMAMAAGLVTVAGGMASATRKGIAMAVERFMAKGGAWETADRAYKGATFFMALGVGSEYYSFNKLSKAMARINTDAAGALDELSLLLHGAGKPAVGDGGELGKLAIAVDNARAELRRQIKADPSYSPDTGAIAGYFLETFLQFFIMDAGLGFFKPAKAAGKPDILKQKISKAKAMPAEAWPVVKAGLSKSQAGAIAKIDAGMEAQISALKTAAANAETGPAAKKQADALLNLKSLFAAEREAYAAWVIDLLARGKLNRAEAEEYFGRMLDWERQQSGKRNVAAMASRPAPANERLETEMKLLQPGANKDALIKVVKEGVYCERLNDINSRDFKEAYAMLRRYFPSDELDPATDIVEMQFQNGRNYAKLCSQSFSKVAPDLKAPLYQRYYLVVAKDKEGKIIGVCDGNFIGAKKVNAMYWAHVAVPEVERRRGIATLLFSSTLDLGNEMAHAAEQSFNKIGISASYKTPISGNKLKYFVLETEPVNQESPGMVSLTWGRLLFHGSLGLSVAPKLRYVQIDLASERGMKFLQSESGGVPLGLAFWEVGAAEGTPVTVGTMRDLSGIMRDGFLSAGLYSRTAAWLDYRHSVQDFKGMPKNARVTVVRLPSSPGVAGVEELAEKVVPAFGTMEERYSLYPNYPWYTGQDGYNNAIKAARENGTYMPVEAAKQLMLEKARKKESTVPVSN
ncbi:MAG: hypothetical protein WC861_04255 [Candidatus Micrarchaeia archaeon]